MPTNAINVSREKYCLSQIDLAWKMRSSQSRVAEIEAGSTRCAETYTRVV